MSASGGNVFSPSTIVLPGNPAAGADWSYALPVAGQVQAVAAILTTSATVAARVPALTFTTAGGVVLAAAQISVSQAASAVWQWSWFAGAQFVGIAGSPQTWVLPALCLPAGAIIRTVTSLLQAGDQWSAIALTLGQSGAF